MDVFDQERLKMYLLTGFISAFGAVVNLLYQKSKGKTVSLALILITLVIGFFVGNVVGSFIPKDFEYRDGTLLIAGFGCYPFLDILESNMKNIIEKFFKKNF